MTPERILELTQRFKQKRIIVIGDVMLDHYISGEVRRISPEAPVPNVDACELHKSECVMGNAVLPGTIALACADAGVPWGHVSSGCIYTGKNADGAGFTETDTPNFTFRTNNCSFYSGTKALGEEVLAGVPNVYRLAPAHPLQPGRRPAQLPDEAHPL
jgi:hypothetical protein